MPSFITYLEVVQDTFFIFDILLNFNTGFYGKGRINMLRKDIAIHYLKSW